MAETCGRRGRAQDTGSLLADPCGGTGMLTYEVVEPAHVDRFGRDVPSRRRTVAARCLCEKGQLRTSPSLPLISDLVQFTDELQDLFPEGVPDIIPPDQVVIAPKVGRIRQSRKRQLQLQYRKGQRHT